VSKLAQSPLSNTFPGKHQLTPYTVIGQSDGGAHVVFRTDYSYSTYLLSYCVREKGIMSLEEAIRKLTFVPASLFGLSERGLVRPGIAADLMVFDPATIGPLEPGGGSAGFARRGQTPQAARRGDRVDRGERASPPGARQAHRRLSGKGGAQC
jgi:Amidohydrolase family